MPGDGFVVSPHPLNTTPKPGRLPARDRSLACPVGGQEGNRGRHPGSNGMLGIRTTAGGMVHDGNRFARVGLVDTHQAPTGKNHASKRPQESHDLTQVRPRRIAAGYIGRAVRLGCRSRQARRIPAAANTRTPWPAGRGGCLPQHSRTDSRWVRPRFAAIESGRRSDGNTRLDWSRTRGH
jgi:hypothetical protein